MLSKEIIIEDIEKTMSEILSNYKPVENILVVIHNNEVLCGTVNSDTCKITTGLGGILKLPRMFTKIIYNNHIVKNHEEFWNILETKFNNLK